MKTRQLQFQPMEGTKIRLTISSTIVDVDTKPRINITKLKDPFISRKCITLLQNIFQIQGDIGEGIDGKHQECLYRCQQHNINAIKIR